MRTLAVLAIAFFALSAHADDQPVAERQARALADEGMARFRRGELDGAIADFEAARALAPRPILLFNLGQAWRLKGDCPRALESYRAYLAAAPAAPNRAKVEGLVAGLPCARAVEPPPVEKPVSPVEPAPPVEQPPPPIEQPPLTVEQPLPPLEKPPLTVEKPAALEPHVAARPRRSSARVAWLAGGGTLLVVGSALIATGGAFTARALDASNQVSALFQLGAKWDDGARAIEARGRDAQSAAAALYVTGGIAAAAGIAAIVIGARRPAHPKLALSPLPGGAAVGWWCEF